MNIAIIPARGGSKRIPRKNIRDFCGKPMIAWSISAARDSGCFERIVVSTDDAEIAEVARAHGAEVPFMRPAALSDDHTTTIPVIAHALQALIDAGATIEAVCCIYATAPFLHVDDLRGAGNRLSKDDVDYVFSVAAYPSPIQRALRVDTQGRVAMFHPEHRGTRSQDLVPAYHDAGQFYWGTRNAWLAQAPIFSNAAAAWILPRYRVQDIDDNDDWSRAEAMLAAMHHKDGQ